MLNWQQIRLILLHIIAAATFAFALPVFSVVAQGQSAAGFKTALSTDGSFQVRYPRQLVHCEHLDAENPDVWSPENSCAASIPVCDSTGRAGNVLLCLAYPGAHFQGSELQAAALAVSRLDSFRTSTECMQRWTNRDTSDVHSEKIGDLTSQAAKVVETQGSYAAEHFIYRIFHKAGCYEIDVNISTALDTAFAAEDRPRKLTLPERKEIKERLTQAVNGFRFLK